jgi:hypothetical protein
MKIIGKWCSYLALLLIVIVIAAQFSLLIDSLILIFVLLMVVNLKDIKMENRVLKTNHKYSIMSKDFLI